MERSIKNYGTIREILEKEYRVDDLKPLAKMLCDVAPTKKDDLVKAVCSAISGDGLKKAFSLLHPLQQSALAEAVHVHGGNFDGSRFAAKYGSSARKTLSEQQKMRDTPWNLFIWSGALPGDLQARLAEFVPIPKDDELNVLDELPQRILIDSDDDNGKAHNTDLTEENSLPLQVRHTDRPALNNLQTILRLVDRGKIKVGPNTGHPTSAATTLISGILDGGDWYIPGEEPDDFNNYSEIGPIQAFAWPLLLQGGGLANADGSVLRLTRAGKAALNENPPDVVRSLWKKWEKTTFFDEFSRINAIRGQTAAHRHHMTSPATRRPVINDALEECPSGKWIAFDEFSRFMCSQDFRFDVARDLWRLYISEPQYGSLGYTGFGKWSIVEGRYLLAYLFEYADSLGLIDVAYLPPEGVRDDFRGNWGTDQLPWLSRYDGLQYFRINPLGAYVFGEVNAYQCVCHPRALLSGTEASRGLKVLPNFDIVAMDRPSLSRADAAYLDSVADKTSDAVWHISPATLLRAAESGVLPDDILSFLTTRSAEPVPQTVSVLLADTKSRIAKFSYLGAGHILACSDPMLVKLVASHRSLSSLCVAADDRYICMLPGKEKAFLKALTDLGYVVPHLRDMIESNR
jgi:hypothetical protein